MRSFNKREIKKMKMNTKNVSDCLKRQKTSKKTLHYSTLIVKYNNNIKKTWSELKKLLRKKKFNNKISPKKIV